MRDDIPLTWFLYFAAASFSIGLLGVLVRRNAIAVLMAIEIMLNAANINLVAFWRYGTPAPGRRGPDRRDAGDLRHHDRRGRGRRGHRPDPALLPPLARRRRRPLRQHGRLIGELALRGRRSAVSPSSDEMSFRLADRR